MLRKWLYQFLSLKYAVNGSCNFQKAIDLFLEKISPINFTQKYWWWNNQSSYGSYASSIFPSCVAYGQLYNINYTISHLWHTINHTSSTKWVIIYIHCYFIFCPTVSVNLQCFITFIVPSDSSDHYSIVPNKHTLLNPIPYGGGSWMFFWRTKHYYVIADIYI